MKKTLFLNITRTLLLILFLFSFNRDVSVANAQMVVSDPSLLTKAVIKDIKDTVAQVKNYMQYATEVYNTGKTVSNTAKNLKNFDLSNVAKNLTGDNIVELGTTILTNVETTKTPGINAFTNGSQVITNLGNYLDKTSVNEIRKTLSTLKDPVNTTPYTSEIQKSIVGLVRNTADKSSGKLINFSLPYITQKEICESDKLKNVIKNGEPENYVKPRAAVENVDIDKLCNANLNDAKSGAKTQATFIALAKSGYAGQKTKLALADPANTASGVISNAVGELEKAKEKALENASKEAESTGLILGNKTCLDKTGKPVKFDPTNPETAFCASQNSSAANSAVLTKDKLSAAAQSPYQAFLAKADAIQEDVDENLDKASDIANILNSILGLGIEGDDFDSIGSGLDNPYVELANSLSNLSDTAKKQKELSASASEANKKYSLGTSEKSYTASDLQEAIALYDRLRETNVTKLNHFAYTYVLLKLLQESATSTMAVNDHSQWFVSKPENMKYLPGSLAQMRLSLQNLTQDMKDLIKDMAKNNYKEQTLKKNLLEIKEDSLSEKEIEIKVKAALENTKTPEEYSDNILDWEYAPEYQQDRNDPTADNSGKVLVLNPDEVTGPFTSANLFDLRIRTYKALWLFNIKRFDENLLKGFGLPIEASITPNMPRPSRAPNLVNTKDSENYSETAFCKKLGINICTP